MKPQNESALNTDKANKNPPLSPLWGIFIILILGFPLFFVLKPKPPKLPSFGPAPAFTLTDQLNRNVTSTSLMGKPSVVNFIFTRCENVCPALSQSMSTLQPDLKKANVQIISFTVDPEYDTPSVLKQYADRFGADHANWLFLTGSVEGTKVISTGYQQAFSKNPEKDGTPDITHSQKMILVDAKGEIRGFYDDNSKGQAELLKGLKRL